MTSAAAAALAASLGLPLPLISPQPGRPAAPQSGNECSREVPRGEAAVPSLAAPQWKLVDQGVFTFRYRFYARAGETRVTAMTVEGERSPVTEGKTIWEDGGEVKIFLRGPIADKEGWPLCLRPKVKDFDLESLYRVLAPKLER